MQTHLVNQLRFELSVANEPLAFQVRHALGESLQSALAQALERVFDQWVFPHEWVKIDRLNIDLGNLPPITDGQWLKALERKLEQALAAELAAKSATQHQEEKAISDIEAFLFFLKTGSLPWWEMPDFWELDGLLLSLIQKQPAKLWEALKKNPFSTQMTQRLVYQFDHSSLTALLQLIIQHANTTESANEVNKAGLRPTFFSELKVETLSTSDFFEIFQRLLPEETSADNLFTHKNNNTPFAEKVGGITPDSNSQVKPRFEFNTELGAEQTPVPRQHIESANDTETGRRYFLKHAGLALAAPFLPTFFKALELLDDKAFKNKEATWQGIFMLYFLATGEQKSPEYNLVLEKLLCGLPLEEPVPARVDLAEAWLMEANELLISMISHWKALKSTSPAGFREAFLKRDGILERRADGGWLLRIERKTHDVLLDTIPWGFSMIKLPWTKGLIHVEW